jgi:hypothetical protein
MATIVGAVWQVFKEKYYKQPKPNINTPTQEEVKKFINQNGSATKIN